MAKKSDPSRPPHDAAPAPPAAKRLPPEAPSAATTPADAGRRHRWLLAGAVLLVSAALAAVLVPRLSAWRAPVEEPLPPWGRLSRMPLFLEQPPQNIAPTDCITADPEWVLPGVQSPSQALGLFRSSGISEADADTLLTGTRCDARGCRTVPDRAFVEGLDSETRGRLYEKLARAPENAYQAHPFTRPVSEERWKDLEPIVGAGLLRRLEWRAGNELQLSDFEVVCRAARTDADRILISEALTRMSTTMAWLTVREDDAIEPLIEYWGRGARTRDLRPFLEAMARVPGGGPLDVVNLLPPFARRRLNTFPRRGDPTRNCFWTAVHFFDVNAPSQDFLELDAFQTTLAREYTRVPWDARAFGDVLVFVNRQGTPVHAANHVADDLVFTKNGLHQRRPWTLQPLSEIRDVYNSAVEVRAYRLGRLPDR